MFHKRPLAPVSTESIALIMDDPDAMGAVGKVWVHWLWDIISHEHRKMRWTSLVLAITAFREKQILVKLVMVDLHLQINDTHTSSKCMH